ncbi:hypothetical protein DND90_20550 [Pseudomonas syringae pv. maculicola]|nr:hypothetical protein DND90_20550 [Pseudomonas syringae pv. maculicola]
MLATQTARDFGGQTTQGLTSSVDDEPVALNCFRFSSKKFSFFIASGAALKIRRRILLNSAYFDKSKAAGNRRYRGLGSARPLYGKILRQTAHHFHCKELANYTDWANNLNRIFLFTFCLLPARHGLADICALSTKPSCYRSERTRHEEAGHA